MTLLRFADYANRREFRTDVLVIGTGAGGAVVGAELAEAGVEVTFVEEGSYNPTSASARTRRSPSHASTVTAGPR